MKKSIRNSLAALALGGLISPSAFATGPEVFQAQGCPKCHSLTVAGIQRAAAHDVEAMDLSTVGARHDKKWVAAWLLKKVDREGEKHKKLFQGTMPDLKILAEYLASLK